MASEGDLTTSSSAARDRARGAGRGARAPGAAVGLRQGAGSSTSPAGLSELGVEIVSTGGTARELAGAGIAVRAIEDFTGFPEIMDGRVKTLHPRLYAGLLARRDDDAHLRAAAEQGIEPVDLVCVNLYPFEQTVARGDASEEEIDREHRHRRPDDDPRGRQEQRVRRRASSTPSDYERVLGELRESDGRLSLRDAQAARGQGVRLHRPLRRRDLRLVRARAPTRASRRRWRDAYEKVSDLRYGENPHQQAAFYARVGLADAPARRGRASCTARSCRSTTCST